MQPISQYHELDDMDQSILRELQREARISNAELARRIHLSQPALHSRIRRLERRGFIRGYVALLDREMAGFDLMCFIHVRLQIHQFDQIATFRRIIGELPQVLECHHVTGEYDYLLKIAVRNRKELEQLVIHKLTPIPGVAHIQTSLVFTEIKATTELPLDI
jgi:DNA-binding Lrp family transcriptional regulator